MFQNTELYGEVLVSKLRVVSGEGLVIVSKHQIVFGEALVSKHRVVSGEGLVIVSKHRVVWRGACFKTPSYLWRGACNCFKTQSCLWRGIVTVSKYRVVSGE